MRLASVFLMMGDIEGGVFVLLNCGETQLFIGNTRTAPFSLLIASHSTNNPFTPSKNHFICAPS